MNTNQTELKALLISNAFSCSHSNVFTVEQDFNALLERGVDSVEKYLHEDAASYHYDAYKEIHGIRPRWIRYSELSLEEINRMNDLLIEESNFMAEMERTEQEEEKKFQKEVAARNEYKPNLAFESLGSLLN